MSKVLRKLWFDGFHIQHGFGLPPSRLSHPDTLLPNNHLAVTPAAFQDKALDPVHALLAPKPRVSIVELVDVEISSEVDMLVAAVSPLRKPPSPQLPGNSSSRPSRGRGGEGCQVCGRVVSRMQRELVP